MKHKEEVKKLLETKLDRLSVDITRTNKYGNVYFISSSLVGQNIMVYDEGDNSINFDCDEVITPLLNIFGREHGVMMNSELQETVKKVLQEMQIPQLDGKEVKFVDIWDSCEKEE